MSLLWNFLDEGFTLPTRNTWGQSFGLWYGRFMATRHRHVAIPRSCRIHPEAKLHPRQGKILMGENCSVAQGGVVQGNVKLGNNCSIQLYSIILGYGTLDNPDGQVTFGNNVQVAPHVLIVAANHIFSDINIPIRDQGIEHAPITIGDSVWIAGRVVITAGVTIGTGAVIGAGSVVTRDIPDYSVAVGVPAKCIRCRKSPAN